MDDIREKNLLHYTGETGIAQVRGGLYLKDFNRIPVDSLFRTAKEHKITFIPKGLTHFWEESYIHAMFDIDLLNSPEAQVFHDLFAAP